MKHLRNAWYAALWGKDLVSGKLTSRTIADVDLVLFRRLDGTVAVLQDRCPHRFAPLSQGKLCEVDTVSCPYHGLRFDSVGTCVANPHGRVPEPARVRNFCAVEKHTMVWVWMGDQPADPSQIPDYSVLDGAFEVTRRDTIELDVNYQLMSDNLLDLSHVSFLHSGILGHDGMVSGHIHVQQQDETVLVNRSTPNVQPPGMFDMMYRRDGQHVDLWADMRWNAPASLLNYTGVCPPGGQRQEGVSMYGAHILTPVSELKTSYHIAAAIIVPSHLRPGPQQWAELMAHLAETRRFAFEHQDEPMVLAQQKALLKAGGLDVLEPVLLSVDAGPVRARRVLDQLMKKEAQLQRAGE